MCAFRLLSRSSHTMENNQKSNNRGILFKVIDLSFGHSTQPSKVFAFGVTEKAFKLSQT